MRLMPESPALAASLSLNLTEEDKLYYTAEAISKTWAVSTYFSAVCAER